MNTITMAPGKYFLKRHEDERSESGNVLDTYAVDAAGDGYYKLVDFRSNNVLEVGRGVRVMSLSSRDGWRTSPITSFESAVTDEDGIATIVVFKTTNSTYTLEVF